MINDSKATDEVLHKLKNKYLSGIIKIFAYGGYRGELIEKGKKKFGRVLEVVKRNEVGNFKVLPKRWIVERTFAWIHLSNEEHQKIMKDNPNQVSHLCNWL
jgi:transposase